MEKAHKDGKFQRYPMLRDFPIRSCGDASILVGESLINNGFENLWYVCGTHYPDNGDNEENFQGIQSHAWISVGNPFDNRSIIVDITGDQFKNDLEYNYYDEPVYVGPIDWFHLRFEYEQSDVHEFNGINGYDESTRNTMHMLYRIMDRL
ncbi:MAG: hypothetical protein IKO16_09250 [Lachnospiraceae bacterium]|nr:hypothetical protein [Lachnospiraceae bacterium]